jgi:hypothetical protein
MLLQQRTSERSRGFRFHLPYRHEQPMLLQQRTTERSRGCVYMQLLKSVHIRIMRASYFYSGLPEHIVSALAHPFRDQPIAVFPPEQCRSCSFRRHWALLNAAITNDLADPHPHQEHLLLAER